MHDQEQQRGQHEEADERQLDVEERQLDRIFKKEVAVGDTACRDKKIEQYEQIADPQAGTDAGGVDDRSAQRLEIFRLVGKGFGAVGLALIRHGFALGHPPRYNRRKRMQTPPGRARAGEQLRHASSATATLRNGAAAASSWPAIST